MKDISFQEYCGGDKRFLQVLKLRTREEQIKRLVNLEAEMMSLNSYPSMMSKPVRVEIKKRMGFIEWLMTFRP